MSAPAPDDAAILAALPIWPLACLDFEANGLGPDSFPIEVGVTVWAAPGEPARSWSRLIRPTAAWLASRWDVEAAAVHGLAQFDLARGLPPAEALAAVDARLGRTAPICDGGERDFEWFVQLAEAAGGGFRGTNAPEDVLLKILDAEGDAGFARTERLQKWYEGVAQPHRAGPDSQAFARALAHAYGVAAAFEEDFA